VINKLTAQQGIDAVFLKSRRLVTITIMAGTPWNGQICQSWNQK